MKIIRDTIKLKVVLCLSNIYSFLLGCLPLFIVLLILSSVISLLLYLKIIDPKEIRDRKKRIITLHKSRLTETDIKFIEKICIEKEAEIYHREVECWEEQIAILNGVIIKENSKRID